MGGDTTTSTPAEQQYSLRWNDFQTSILSSFRHLRDEEDFVDVTLACDGRSFSAHKVVLSACSPYFRRLLKANPCQHPIVILRDVQQKDMESLLRFMYNGEVHIGQEQLTDFLKTAQMLQVRGLADVPAGAAAMQKVITTSDHQKISPNSSSLPWATDRPDAIRDRDALGGGSLSPPPAKRSRSTDHNRSTYTPDRGRSPSRDNADIPESLLGQALEGGPTLHTNTERKDHSVSSLQAQSTGEDSNSSDHDASDAEDRDDPVTPKTEPADYPLGGSMDDLHHHSHHHHPYTTNGSLMDQSRTPTFPGALLGLQGLPGLLPGPSGMHGSVDSFANRRSLDMMRVRATDPRPCPKCGKIYRSAHTLRTHLEDKHTICPGYRCVLCGTVAKSRNSLHSHMSRQHRGISTKDLPVLPMPAPFDPEMASRLLAKAGVKISPAELRARASPTGPRRSDVKLDAKSMYAASEGGSSICGDNDPEDLTVSAQAHHQQHSAHQSRYSGFDLAMSPPLLGNHHHNNSGGGGGGYGNHHHHGGNGTGLKQHHRSSSGGGGGGGALAAKSMDMHSMGNKEGYAAPVSAAAQHASTGSAILDTYLQLITDNSGMLGGMMGEQAAAAAAAVQAAKLAQLNATMTGLDKASQHAFLEKMQQQMAGAVVASDYMLLKQQAQAQQAAQHQQQQQRNDEILRSSGDVVMQQLSRLSSTELSRLSAVNTMDESGGGGGGGRLEKMISDSVAGGNGTSGGLGEGGGDSSAGEDDEYSEDELDTTQGAGGGGGGQGQHQDDGVKVGE